MQGRLAGKRPQGDEPLREVAADSGDQALNEERDFAMES